MTAFEGWDDGLGFDLDELDLPDIAEITDAAGAATAAGLAIDLPDPFADTDPQTAGMLADSTATMAAASDEYAQIAAAEGLAPDLPSGPLESARAAIDAAENASPEQAHYAATQLEGMAASQEIVNSVRADEQDARDAEETIHAASEAEMLAWEADRAADAAARAVEESRDARGA